MEMISEGLSKKRTTTRGETVAGLLPVIALTLATTLEGSGNQGWLSYLPMYILIALLYALPTIAVPVAVKSGVPRWSSGYLGLLVIDLMLLPLIFSKQTWQDFGGAIVLQITVIVLLVALIVRLVTALRKMPEQPPKGVDNSWTQVLLGAQTLVPLYLMVIFDEIGLAAKTTFLLLNGLILAAGALAYLRARRSWLGVAALLGSVLLVVPLASYLTVRYWNNHPWG
jgi:hypothetical protein